MIEEDNIERFGGYDFEELLDEWDLRDEDTEIGNALYRMMELGCMTDWAEKQDEVTLRLMVKYINDHAYHDSNGDCTLDVRVKNDIRLFLLKLRNNQYASEGTIGACLFLDQLSKSKDDHDFIRWFCHCLPMLWV